MTIPGHPPRRTWRLAAVAMSASVLAGGAGLAADPVVAVTQRDRAFTAGAVTVPVGGILRVDNDDEFVHQIYIDQPGMSYESDEQEPGKTVDVQFTKPGTFEMRCRIHPRMRLQVTVR